MAKKRTKGSIGKEFPYVGMPWKMLKSKAYIDLPPTARGMLPYFLGQVQLEGWMKNPLYYETTFKFEYSTARKYGCAQKSFYRAIRALVAKGFIDPVWIGGLRGLKKTSSIFKLSKRWHAYWVFR